MWGIFERTCVSFVELPAPLPNLKERSKSDEKHGRYERVNVYCAWTIRATLLKIRAETFNPHISRVCDRNCTVFSLQCSELCAESNLTAVKLQFQISHPERVAKIRFNICDGI